jgi:hypothetical protein
MKHGLWIGGFVLALMGAGPHLRAEDVQWRAVSDTPPTQAPAAALEAPQALKAKVVTATYAPAPLPDGLLPVSFETPAPEVPKTLPPRPTNEIIAVSAPVTAPSLAPVVAEEEEQTDSLFAVDRPLRPSVPRRRASGPVVRTSASVPAGAPVEVPTVPGWDAPADASWGVGTPLAPFTTAYDASLDGGVNLLHPRLYLQGEYLLWWIQGDPVPVLATTSAPSDFAVLGAPSTQVLFGGNSINGNSPFSGARFTAGYWLGCDGKTAVEITGFFLAPRSANFHTDSSLNPVIGRPFQEANNGQETAQLTALPNVSVGSLNIHSPSSLWGLEGNLRCILCCGCNCSWSYRVTALAGFRNINLDERLTITENVQGLATAPPPFTNQTITVMDSFATQNHFYGGQVGIDGRWYWGRWSVDGRIKVALGDTVQQLDINGSQRFVSPSGTVQNFTGGLLALPSNIGHLMNNAFSVVPEAGVNVGYQILPRLRGYVGYNFLYWSNVIRPGSSIDRVLDVTQIPNFPVTPTPAPVPGQHPAPTFHQEGFWAQGITFGFEFIY